MNKELDTILCERYPLIFADRNGDITTSCMPFGFECGDHGQLLVAGGWLMTRCQAHAPDSAITYDEYQRIAP